MPVALSLSPSNVFVVSSQSTFIVQIWANVSMFQFRNSNEGFPEETSRSGETMSTAGTVSSNGHMPDGNAPTQKVIPSPTRPSETG